MVLHQKTSPEAGRVRTRPEADLRPAEPAPDRAMPEGERACGMPWIKAPRMVPGTASRPPLRQVGGADALLTRMGDGASG